MSGRAASGGALAPEPPRSTRSTPVSMGAWRRRAFPSAARRRRAPTGSDTHIDTDFTESSHPPRHSQTRAQGVSCAWVCFHASVYVRVRSCVRVACEHVSGRARVCMHLCLYVGMCARARVLAATESWRQQLCLMASLESSLKSQ